MVFFLYSKSIKVLQNDKCFDKHTTLHNTVHMTHKQPCMNTLLHQVFWPLIISYKMIQTTLCKGSCVFRTDKSMFSHEFKKQHYMKNNKYYILFITMILTLEAIKNWWSWQWQHYCYNWTWSSYRTFPTEMIYNSIKKEIYFTGFCILTSVLSALLLPTHFYIYIVICKSI